jgi:hypothetical protein
MGVTVTALQPMDAISAEYHSERKRIETIREVWIAETGTVAEAYEKLVEEFTFTLFNRLAALKPCILKLLPEEASTVTVLLHTSIGWSKILADAVRKWKALFGLWKINWLDCLPIFLCSARSTLIICYPLLSN